jgi:hypothetical protein
MAYSSLGELEIGDWKVESAKVSEIALSPGVSAELIRGDGAGASI